MIPFGITSFLVVSWFFHNFQQSHGGWAQQTRDASHQPDIVCWYISRPPAERMGWHCSNRELWRCLQRKELPCGHCSLRSSSWEESVSQIRRCGRESPEGGARRDGRGVNITENTADKTCNVKAWQLDFLLRLYSTKSTFWGSSCHSTNWFLSTCADCYYYTVFKKKNPILLKGF